MLFACPIILFLLQQPDELGELEDMILSVSWLGYPAQDRLK
jgi:hypothetical protein